MLTVRLSKEMEDEIEKIASIEKATKTQIIKEALKAYIRKKKSEKTPYELGMDLFGKYEFKDAELSQNYKKKLKEKLIEKHSH